MLIFGALASILLVAIQMGDTATAAYQTIVLLMVISGFLPFFHIFASAWRCGKRAPALSGTAVSLLAVVCAVVPSADINRVWLFELKLAIGIAAVILPAFLVYRRKRY
jgi:hypothetical protein